MLNNSVSNAKITKIAQFFEKNNLPYTDNEDLSEFYNNLKNLFTLLLETEVDRVNKTKR